MDYESHPNRPPSEQMVDLHVYVVPPSLWQERLHSAFNQIIGETVSAGFIRVFPESLLQHVRTDIERQLGYEIVPRSFVFCKSVGRCLTQVRSRQEKELKVKHFLPPHAYCPEIFVLDYDIARRTQSSSDGSIASNRSYPQRQRQQPPPLPLQQQQNVESPHQSQSRSPVPFDSGLDMDYEEVERDRLRRIKEEAEARRRLAELDARRKAEEEEERRRREEEERRRREAEERRRWEEEERRRRQEEEEERKRRQEEEERRRREDEERRMLEEEERRRRQDEEDERRRRLEEEERRRRLEDEERRRRLEEEERRRRLEEEEEERRWREEEAERQRLAEDAERRRREDEEYEENSGFIPNLLIEEATSIDPQEEMRREREELLSELQRVRDERSEIERRRDDLIKRARQLQARTQNMRNQARDMWKKRYFEEKKLTTPLEDQANRLRDELESYHKRMVTTMTSRVRDGKNIDTPDATQQLNLRIQATRIQHEIEELQRRVDDSKMKLTAEVKLRTQAEAELRAMKAELTQRKLNLSMTRTQQMGQLVS